MKKINWKLLITTSIICFFPILLGITFYNSVPEQIAIHFDISNNPNMYMNKNIVLFGFPIILGLVQAVLCVISDTQKTENSYIPMVEYIYKSILPIITVAAYSITLAAALGIPLDIRRIVVLLIGIILILFGNYLPKTSVSYSCGVRPKSLVSNEGLYRKIKKLMGYSFVVFGILFIISIFLPNIYSVYTIIFMLIILLIQILYYLFAFKLQQ